MMYGRPIAIVNFDVGQSITIYPNDDIQAVVEIYCEKNDLD